MQYTRTAKNIMTESKFASGLIEKEKNGTKLKYEGKIKKIFQRTEEKRKLTHERHRKEIQLTNYILE